MSQKYLAFARAHEVGVYREARSPWVCLNIQRELNVTPVPDLSNRFHDVPIHAWQGRFDARYNGWKSDKASERGENTEPEIIYELLFVAEKAVRDMTRAQATMMVNELSHNTMTALTWIQEQDRAAAILGFRPSSAGAARTHYRRGQNFMDYLTDLITKNDPTDARLLKFEFDARLLEPQPKLQDRPTGAMRELAVPTEATPAQEVLRARRGKVRNRQAFIEAAYFRMMASKKGAAPTS
jgi:hypothetical protein